MRNMTELTNKYFEKGLKSLTYREGTKRYNKEKTELLMNTVRMELFSRKFSLNTVEDLIEMGIDGLKGSETTSEYKNIYLCSSNCFKGKSFKKEFSSYTLYNFWNNCEERKSITGIDVVDDNGNLIHRELFRES